MADICNYANDRPHSTKSQVCFREPLGTQIQCAHQEHPPCVMWKVLRRKLKKLLHSLNFHDHRCRCSSSYFFIMDVNEVITLTSNILKVSNTELSKLEHV